MAIVPNIFHTGRLSQFAPSICCCCVPFLFGIRYYSHHTEAFSTGMRSCSCVPLCVLPFVHTNMAKIQFSLAMESSLCYLCPQLPRDHLHEFTCFQYPQQLLSLFHLDFSSRKTGQSHYQFIINYVQLYYVWLTDAPPDTRTSHTHTLTR